MSLAGGQTGLNSAGRCENWFQSLAIGLGAGDGRPIPQLAALTLGQTNRAHTNRQAILDIAPSDQPDQFIVTGFQTAAHAEQKERCQDNIFVGIISQAGNRWNLNRAGQLIGANNADDVAYSIKPVGGGSYLLAGFGRDNGAPAAQVYRVRLRPFAVERHLSEPYPKDGSVYSEGIAIEPSPRFAEQGFFLLAGSVSVGARSRTKECGSAFRQISRLMMSPSYSVAGAAPTFMMRRLAQRARYWRSDTSPMKTDNASAGPAFSVTIDPSPSSAGPRTVI